MERPPKGPRPLSRPVEVLSIKKNTVQTVRFLGGIDGILTHWIKKPGFPCAGISQCGPQHHRIKTIWKGYSAVEAWDDHAGFWIPFVLEVTESLEEVLYLRPLIGEVWILSRPQPDEKPAPVLAQFLEQQEPSRLRAAFPVRPVVSRMYGTSNIEWEVKNPVPRKVYLEPSEDAAPPSLYDPVIQAPPSITAAELATLREAAAKAGLLKRKGPTDGRDTPTTNGTGKH